MLQQLTKDKVVQGFNLGFILNESLNGLDRELKRNTSVKHPSFADFLPASHEKGQVILGIFKCLTV